MHSQIFTNVAHPKSNLCALCVLRGEFLNTLLGALNETFDHFICLCDDFMRTGRINPARAFCNPSEAARIHVLNEPDEATKVNLLIIV